MLKNFFELFPEMSEGEKPSGGKLLPPTAKEGEGSRPVVSSSPSSSLIAAPSSSMQSGSTSSRFVNKDPALLDEGEGEEEDQQNASGNAKQSRRGSTDVTGNEEVVHVDDPQVWSVGDVVLGRARPSVEAIVVAVFSEGGKECVQMIVAPYRVGTKWIPAALQLVQAEKVAHNVSRPTFTFPDTPRILTEIHDSNPSWDWTEEVIKRANDLVLPKLQEQPASQRRGGKLEPPKQNANLQQDVVMDEARSATQQVSKNYNSLTELQREWDDDVVEREVGQEQMLRMAFRKRIADFEFDEDQEEGIFVARKWKKLSLPCPFIGEAPRVAGNFHMNLEENAEERKFVRLALQNIYADFTTAAAFADNIASIHKEKFKEKPFTLEITFMKKIAKILDEILLRDFDGPWMQWSKPCVDATTLILLEISTRLLGGVLWSGFKSHVRRVLRKWEVGNPRNSEFGPTPVDISKKAAIRADNRNNFKKGDQARNKTQTGQAETTGK